ncbi:MAG: hypothetical protein M3T96_09740 [Acidobacteriota bacterium]|nr:hypothetical protein [Acidobacteriota bacterium]
MTDARQAEEILKQYAKHGWILRRVLLSAPTIEKLPAAVFGQTDVIAADFDALWFARSAANGGEAWELRHLSAIPFALVEVFDEDDDEETREEMRSELETQMRNRASKPVVQNRKV